MHIERRTHKCIIFKEEGTFYQRHLDKQIELWLIFPPFLNLDMNSRPLKNFQTMPIKCHKILWVDLFDFFVCEMIFFGVRLSRAQNLNLSEVYWNEWERENAFQMKIYDEKSFKSHDYHRYESVVVRTHSLASHKIHLVFFFNLTELRYISTLQSSHTHTQSTLIFIWHLDAKYWVNLLSKSLFVYLPIYGLAANDHDKTKTKTHTQEKSAKFCV